ncbi:MAG: alanine transaminase [Gammaproteobacteria bacterium CG11_big_fil_rev_8_21_14_0_20_46_22]|nr:MAG: alanine transaminase [Gammaproteobacteria bacterium CG12_big_fil_rev_8_21_14_0_65_46_12]PIR11985.1 MAG: alanine transaminase [Gammaproteobacteria bacterium CG11_big_fil_rev_8_21_14_0_20_46_22]
MQPFSRIQRLPPYVFSLIDELKSDLLADGRTIIDFGMGNPDQPAPAHVVEAMKAAMDDPKSHRYSVSRGITELREAICQWYKTRYGVKLDPSGEAIATMGSKEGLAHLILATMGPGDTALVPNPAYPIHPFGFVIAGADVRHVPMQDEKSFLKNLQDAIKESWPAPKMLVLNFPSNPTAYCVNLIFFEKIIDIARKHGIWVVHDLAYADIVFDGYKAPSILQVPGAKEIAVETYSLSKSYNMAGWRCGFVCGNPTLIEALGRMKSYLDYGMFTPIQKAAVTALTGPQDCVAEIRATYQHRRDLMCESLADIGWAIQKPKATMFLWAKIPEKFRDMGSLMFSKWLLEKAGVAVSPGIGFGEYGNDHVRFSLIQGGDKISYAVEAMSSVLKL